MASSNQEKYLQRKTQQHRSFIFDWFDCCTSTNTPTKQDKKEMMIKNTIMIKKKPLKSATNKFNNSFDKSSKQNSNQFSINFHTQRNILQMKPTSRITQTSNFYSNTLRHKIQPIKNEKTIKNSKVRFSYIHPKINIQNIQQKQNNRSSKIAMTVYDVSSQNSNLSQIGSNSNKTNNTSFSQATPFLIKKQSAQSVKKKPKFLLNKANKDHSTLDLFTLKMRQVQSIRQPQDNSDHESIVQEKSDSIFFGLLRPIKEIQKQSHIQLI